MIDIELIEFEPGRFHVKRERLPAPRSDLPCPNVISDEMPETEQVDGKFYTSKAMFRAVGRAHGLIEVGNEKQKPKVRGTADKTFQRARKESIGKALAEYKMGRRPKVTRHAE